MKITNEERLTWKAAAIYYLVCAVFLITVISERVRLQV